MTDQTVYTHVVTVIKIEKYTGDDESHFIYFSNAAASFVLLFSEKPDWAVGDKVKIAFSKHLPEPASADSEAG